MAQDFITRAAFNPEWDKATRIHDWRNHVAELRRSERIIVEP